MTCLLLRTAGRCLLPFWMRVQKAENSHLQSLKTVAFFFFFFNVDAGRAGEGFLLFVPYPVVRALVQDTA